MKYPLKQVMGMMPEINQKSNDRSSFLWEELHSDRMAQQNTCALASTQYGFPRQLAHRRNPGGDIHDAPRGVTFTQRLACARVFQFSACVRILLQLPLARRQKYYAAARGRTGGTRGLVLIAPSASVRTGPVLPAFLADNSPFMEGGD